MKELFAIFGDPVTHSKSPLMHNCAFKALTYDACYIRYHLSDGSRLREKFFELDLAGANITVPHKEEAFRACDELDEFALKVGSVNTIVKRDGKLYGYNTDATGFLKSIEEFKDFKKILILGAGGTSKALSVILRDNGYEVEILNRSQARLTPFIALGFKTYSFDTFSMTNFDIIINTTSAGLSDNSLPAPLDILTLLFDKATICIDIIYGKETPFLKLAKEAKKITKDGSDMLLHQGIKAFEHFTQYHFDSQEIHDAMKKAFILS